MNQSFQKFVHSALQQVCGESDPIVVPEDPSNPYLAHLWSQTDLVIQDEISLFKSCQSKTPEVVAQYVFQQACRAIQLRPRQKAYMIILTDENSTEQKLIKETTIQTLKERASRNSAASRIDISVDRDSLDAAWPLHKKWEFALFLRRFIESSQKDGLQVPASDVEFESRMKTLMYDETYLQNQIRSRSFTLMVHLFPNIIEFKFKDGRFASDTDSSSYISATFGDTANAMAHYTQTFIKTIAESGQCPTFPRVQWQTDSHHAVSFILAKDVCGAIRKMSQEKKWSSHAISPSIYLKWTQYDTNKQTSPITNSKQWIVFPIDAFGILERKVVSKNRVASSHLLLLFGWIAQPFDGDDKSLEKALDFFSQPENSVPTLELLEKCLVEFLKRRVEQETPTFSTRTEPLGVYSAELNLQHKGKYSPDILNFFTRDVIPTIDKLSKDDALLLEICKKIYTPTEKESIDMSSSDDLIVSSIHFEKLILVFWTRLGYLLSDKLFNTKAKLNKGRIDIDHTLQLLSEKYNLLHFATSSNFPISDLVRAFVRSTYAPIYQYLNLLNLGSVPVSMFGTIFPVTGFYEKTSIQHVPLYHYGTFYNGHSLSTKLNSFSLPTSVRVSAPHKTWLLENTIPFPGAQTEMTSKQVTMDIFSYEIFVNHYPRWRQYKVKDKQAERIQDFITKQFEKKIKLCVFSDLDTDTLSIGAAFLLTLLQYDANSMTSTMIAVAVARALPINTIATFFQSIARLRMVERPGFPTWTEVVSVILSMLTEQLPDSTAELLQQKSAYVFGAKEKWENIENVKLDDIDLATFVSPLSSATKPTTTSPKKTPTKTTISPGSLSKQKTKHFTASRLSQGENETDLDQVMLSSEDMNDAKNTPNGWQQTERLRRDEFENLYLRLVPFAIGVTYETSMIVLLKQVKERRDILYNSVVMLEDLAKAKETRSDNASWATSVKKGQEKRIQEIDLLIGDVTAYIEKTQSRFQKKRRVLLSKYPSVAKQQGIDITPTPKKEKQPVDDELLNDTTTTTTTTTTATTTTTTTSTPLISPPKKGKMTVMEYERIASQQAVLRFLKSVKSVERPELTVERIVEIFKMAVLCYCSNLTQNIQDASRNTIFLEFMWNKSIGKLDLGNGTRFSPDDNANFTEFLNLVPFSPTREFISNTKSRESLFEPTTFCERTEFLASYALDELEYYAQLFFNNCVKTNAAKNVAERDKNIKARQEEFLNQSDNSVLKWSKDLTKGEFIVLSMILDCLGLAQEFGRFSLEKIRYHMKLNDVFELIIRSPDSIESRQLVAQFYQDVVATEYAKYLSIKCHDRLLVEGMLEQTATRMNLSHRFPFKFYQEKLLAKHGKDKRLHSYDIYYIPLSIPIAGLVTRAERKPTEFEQGLTDFEEMKTRLLTRLGRLAGIKDLPDRDLLQSYAVIDEIWTTLMTDRFCDYTPNEDSASDTFSMPGISFIMAQSLHHVFYDGGAPLIVTAVLFDDLLLPRNFNKESFVSRMITNQWILQVKTTEPLTGFKDNSSLKLPSVGLAINRDRSVFSARQWFQENITEVDERILVDKDLAMDVSDVIGESAFLTKLATGEIDYFVGSDRTPFSQNSDSGQFQRIDSSSEQENYQISFLSSRYMEEIFKYASYVAKKNRDSIDNETLLALAKKWCTSQMSLKNLHNLSYVKRILPEFGEYDDTDPIATLIVFCSVMTRHLDDFVRVAVEVFQNHPSGSLEQEYIRVYVNFWLGPYNQPHRFDRLLEWLDQIASKESGVEKVLEFNSYDLSVFIERCIHRSSMWPEHVSDEEPSPFQIEEFQSVFERIVDALKKEKWANIKLPSGKLYPTVEFTPDELPYTASDDADQRANDLIQQSGWVPKTQFEMATKLMVEGKFGKLGMAESTETLLAGTGAPLDIDTEEVTSLVGRLGNKSDTDAVKKQFTEQITTPVAYTVIEFLTHQCHLNLDQVSHFQKHSSLKNGVKLIEELHLLASYLFGCLQIKAKDTEWRFMDNRSWWSVPKNADANVRLVPTIDQSMFVKQGPSVSKEGLYQLLLNILDTALIPIKMAEFLYNHVNGDVVDGGEVYQFFVAFMKDLQIDAEELVQIYSDGGGGGVKGKKHAQSSTFVKYSAKEKEFKVRKLAQELLVKAFGDTIHFRFTQPVTTKTLTSNYYHTGMKKSDIRKLSEDPEIVKFNVELASKMSIDTRGQLPFERMPVIKTREELEQTLGQLQLPASNARPTEGAPITFLIKGNQSVKLTSDVTVVKEKILTILRKSLAKKSNDGSNSSDQQTTIAFNTYEEAIEQLGKGINNHVAIVCRFVTGLDRKTIPPKIIENFYEPLKWNV